MTKPSPGSSRISAKAGLGFIVLAIVVFLYNLSDYITPDQRGFYRNIEKSVQTFVAIMAMWVLMRLARILIWDTYAHKRGEAAPDLLKTAINVVIVIVTLIFIVTQIYEKNYMAIVAAAGFLGIGAGLGLQGLILDAFAGLILELENRVGNGQWIGVGDWIQIEDINEPVRVTNMTWRYTMMRTEDNHSVLLPNGRLTKKVLRNYSRPYGGFTEHIEVTLDHNVPVARAAAILHEAVAKVPNIEDVAPIQVNTMSTNSGGVVYEVEFVIADYDDMKPVRHRVFEAITRSLHERGLRLSETMGVMPFYTDPLILENPPPNIDVLKTTDLFTVLGDDQLNQLADKAKRHMSMPQTILCKQGDHGDSLFIIGEGTIRIYREEIDKQTKQPVQIPLVQLYSGAYFGEMALLTGEPRSAFVETVSQAFLIEISKEDLKPILQEQPQLATALAQVVMQRRQNLNENITDTKNRLKAQHEESQKLVNRIREFFGF